MKSIYNNLLHQRDVVFFEKYGKLANSLDFKKLLNLFGFSGVYYCGKGLAYSPDGINFYVSGHDYDYFRHNYDSHWLFSGCVKPYFEWDKINGFIKFIERK